MHLICARVHFVRNYLSLIFSGFSLAAFFDSLSEWTKEAGNRSSRAIESTQTGANENDVNIRLPSLSTADRLLYATWSWNIEVRQYKRSCQTSSAITGCDWNSEVEPISSTSSTLEDLPNGDYELRMYLEEPDSSPASGSRRKRQSDSRRTTEQTPPVTFNVNGTCKDNYLACLVTCAINVLSS